MNLKHLVPGRSCGTCNVCCVVPLIDEPSLRKPPGVRCRNARPDNGCAIYDDRSPTCRDFYCGWRLFKWVPEAFRPDHSGVLIRKYKPDAHRRGQLPGAAIVLVPDAKLDSDGLCATIIGGIQAGMPIYLEVPGHPGYTAAIAPISQPISRAVLDRDKPAMLGFVRDAVRQAAKLPRSLVILGPETQATPTGSAAPSGTADGSQSATTRGTR